MRVLSTLPVYILISLLLLFCSTLRAQDSDELFREARTAAFEKKNYPLAIQLSKEALSKSPDYKDIRIFLGRVYTWSDKPDSARAEFKTVLKQEQGHEDASLAYASLEFWNDQYNQALQLTNDGLQFHPESKDLLLLKAKILNNLNRYKEADKVVTLILRTDPKNTAARAISQRIRENSSKNKFGLSYDFVHFDEQFSDPWQLVSFDYGRQTRLGSVSARINYANRFKSEGLQFEVDAYPKLSPMFYTYVSGGYSADGIFPNYRAGFSLYANLPASFEADAGFRLLRFDDNTWIYTLALGKYYKNYWFNFRAYLTPAESSLSHSYSLNVRYYLGGADDYIRFAAGTGLSPDVSTNTVLIGGVGENGEPGSMLVTDVNRLKSNNLTLGFTHSFKALNVLSLNLSWVNQEYQKNIFGNQTTAALSYQRRF
ncbi:YaiO family outer membrane beta-barrel protein [Paradesertivirga mongoliensis]|uniref:YaiO family outer membrane beta-barrel protein n=1 Tax=Paradesertivirga mongoliensis TaxID=2100740 RepID=A0ABW4ZNS4_9SPHI|nr:YaiO family outer membrane beta-barrel protein [Pedobacter mongoliensis]